MNLRSAAEKDLSSILEDNVRGGGWEIRLTNPDGVSQDMVGWSVDISQIIDPDTGQLVMGRAASVALRSSSLKIGTPEGIANSSSKPWLVKFDDINGNPYTFKVSVTNPDRGLGVISLMLEAYTV